MMELVIIFNHKGNVMKLEELAATVEKLTARITVLESKINEKRDRGPESTREMTIADAERIMIGDLKGVAHKAAAEALGLSYGQVYSARGGYTFKGVYKKAQALK